MSQGKTDQISTPNDFQIYVSWKNLQFQVPDPNDKKQTKMILNDLSGCAKPGEVIGMIGPSGSGKSSFLNCIAGRNTEGVSGEILFNDVQRPLNFARFTGYVIQDDLYFESLTVHETLKFAASLKLSKEFTKKHRQERIDSIIDELDLHNCRDTIIGGIGSGISGGERRRLAIGLEIINEPKLLLLDEPTSGLDSASALMVGNILKRLARQHNITILCTVHQPRYSLATMFDKLYFLGKGHELYFGPSIPKCLPFFEDAGFKCPEYDNPADFLLDLVNTTPNGNGTAAKDEDAKHEAENDQTTTIINMDDTEQHIQMIGDQRDKIIMQLSAAYQASEYRKAATQMTVPSHLHGDIIFKTIASEFYITPVFNQITVVSHRSFIHKFREPIATMTQAFNAIIMPLLFGSIYWQLDLSTQSAFDRISAIALMVLTISFFPMDVLMLFPLERDIFNREQAAGMYRPFSFFVGRTIAETPQHLIFGWIMGTIAYWMYGLQNDTEHYLTFMLIVEAMVLAASGLMIAFSAMAQSLEQSNLVATFFLLLFMLFDGNWISLDKVPVYWRWIRHISCLGYASQAAIVNEYKGLHFVCSEWEMERGYCLDDITGESIIYNRGMEDVDVMFNIMMLFILAAAYRVVAFFCFWLLFRNRSPGQIIKNTCGCK
eukprot:446696_1